MKGLVSKEPVVLEVQHGRWLSNDLIRIELLPLDDNKAFGHYDFLCPYENAPL